VRLAAHLETLVTVVVQTALSRNLRGRSASVAGDAVWFEMNDPFSGRIRERREMTSNTAFERTVSDSGCVHGHRAAAQLGR
jgi:hypothetical protein